MATTEARIAANRRNAQKSTGPKTAEGKARSRANALTHGLTGAGVVIPADDRAKVAEMEAKLAADIPPANELAASLIHRYAVFSARLDRCADHDAATTARRVRRAVVDRDNERYDEVAALARGLADDPFDAARRLKQTPEGIDCLLGRWEQVRFDLDGPGANPAEIADRAGQLLGLTPGQARASAWGAWGRSSAGEAEAAAPARWVDAEVAALRELRDAIDEEAEAADRAEAPARALFDFGPEAERMRRYEAAAERHLFRTLRELRQAQAEAAASQNEPKPAPAPAPVPAPPARIPAPAVLPPTPPRSILDDLPAPNRAPVRETGGLLDLFAAAPGLSMARGGSNRKGMRPRLR